MDGYELEPAAFFINDDGSVTLFRGTSLEHGRKPVLVKGFEL